MFPYITIQSELPVVNNSTALREGRASVSSQERQQETNSPLQSNSNRTQHFENQDLPHSETEDQTYQNMNHNLSLKHIQKQGKNPHHPLIP